MKKYSIYFLVILLSVGCKKFLEQPPDNRAVLNTPEKVSQLLGTAYPQANYMAFTESISDNVADKGIGGLYRTNIDPYNFKDVSSNQQDSPEFYWNACYAAIAAANQALEVCSKASNPESYAAQKGEALVCRAYAHFMLVTFFSKVFDPATAGSDPGIPYVLKPEKVVFEQYERKTVQYVYEMIEKDLTEGLPLIDDKQYKVPRYHFTRAAAHAFASRFYLFKRQYAKVVEHASKVFPNDNVIAMLRPWNTEYRVLTYNELWARYAKATESANLLLVETPSLWARNYVGVRYGLDATKSNEILLAPNVSGGTWIFRYQLYTGGTNNYFIPKVNEYFVRESVNAEIGWPYVMVPLFTAEEVMFNRAEANVFLNNITNVLGDLNAYASTRIYNYSPALHTITESRIKSFYRTGNAQQGALAAVLDFKRAEFVQEGMRWFDLLRHKVPVVHATVEGPTFTLGANDPMRVFQIPDVAKLAGIAQNPR
ncbi:RagB/SusD family nutrient uptake outer membrane protein [Niastella caeni]|uniref:RagB/SusD family nutrient uptake outer membrane protein n=1 Tax=Niastella caeni TaxID=2569763 RepID=A0A4S8HXF5_9BACT|nr:RagB/SusD family nutrient uptake outer membrane protein [Niastella caeni]THU40428.1 RagB/SusD family nutrient uptake outer membrane protein [Niastella caeni]